MKKLFAVLFVVAFMFSASYALADQGGEPNNTHCNGVGNDNSPCQPKPEPPNPCADGSCTAEGNFNISTFAAGGGIDYDSLVFAGNGATGGVSVAGGISAAQASGHVQEIPVYKKTYMGNKYGWGRLNPRNYSKKLVGTIQLGDASGALNSTAGGFTRTESYTFKPLGFDKAQGLGTSSDGYATTHGSIEIAAHGLAGASASMFGIAGQATLDGSIIGPHDSFDSKGVSLGVAGQGSVGGFIGGAGVFGYGDVAVEAGVDMWGGSVSESYRGVNYDGNTKTETMGTYVGAFTDINSYSNVDRNGLAGGFVEGGYVAGGIAATKTVQAVATETGGGVAAAKAFGTYSGSGDLGCDFNGTANGYSQTSATTMKGYNGAVMNSQAGMSVSIGQQAD